MRQPVETKRQRRAPPRLGVYGARLMARLARKTRLADPELVERWRTIVGPDIADLGRPGRIAGGHGGRTLEIVARNGAAAAALQMRIDEIILAVNGYLGAGSVERIALRQYSGARAGTSPPAESAQQPRRGGLSRFRAAIHNDEESE
ncbi:MAG: DUF721 domain-containing protein [Pseudomonadota bacterium]